MSQETAAVPSLDTALERVLEVVRTLAEEVGGPRASRAVTPTASLDRDIGLGSLERIELMLRIESAFACRCDDRFLSLDTPQDVARLLTKDGRCAIPLPGAPPDPTCVESVSAVSAATPAQEAATIHESLWMRAEEDPRRPHVYLREDDGSETTVTYGVLRDLAAAVAGGLRERGVAAGDTVALMLPTGLDFLAAFQGILLARAIPVPIYPPVRLDRIEEYAARQSAILADAGVKVLVTVERGRVIAPVLRAAVRTLRAVVTVAELTEIGASWGSPAGRSDEAAFIQYTSGSTGTPKGVLLTHANLLANIDAITKALEAQPDDVGASWLPLYHDMGLIGSWLFCMHAGLPIAIQSPLSFLARPERWLWTIHQRRVTLSPAPNFAYELCVRKIQDDAIEGLDLSSWRVALNGAEPVNPETLDRFVRRFGPYGFRREAFLPVYGLAENSVAVCFPRVGRGPRVDRVSRAAFEKERRAEVAAPSEEDALRFVSVGAAVANHEVKIVDDAGADIGDRVVGRLVFRGPSMTSGYFRQPEATEAITTAGGFLDSGDLAYRADGEFYVTGRRKDLIIKAGRNLVPQEIEEIASTVPGIRKGCVVAVGVAHPTLGTESLVVVAETRAKGGAERDRLAAEIVEKVSAATGVPPDHVALVPPGAVPKTSSGKIRRAATRDLYLAGSLGEAPRQSPATRARLALGLASAWVAPRARQLARAGYGAYLAVAMTGLALVFWTPVAVLRRRPLAIRLGRLAARAMFRLTGCRLSATGTERVRDGVPALLACNHSSFTDVLALMALLPVDFAFVSKKEVAGWPVIGTFIKVGRHITVDREDVAQSVSNTAKIRATLAEGRPVLVFPEATFTPSPGLRPFRLGVFDAAVETGLPVIPMALRGTRRVLRDKTMIPRPGPIHLWVGEPIAPEGAGFQAVLALRARVADAIAEQCGEPRLDLVAAGPPRSAITASP